VKKWSHGYHAIESKVFARSTFSRSAIGGGASRGVSLPCGCPAVDCAEDWLHPQDVAGVGESSRSRGRQPARMVATAGGGAMKEATHGERMDRRIAWSIFAVTAVIRWWMATGTSSCANHALHPIISKAISGLRIHGQKAYCSIKRSSMKVP